MCATLQGDIREIHPENVPVVHYDLDWQDVGDEPADDGPYWLDNRAAMCVPFLALGVLFTILAAAVVVRWAFS